MFFSKSNENSELSTFSAILNSYSNGESKLESIVMKVLSEAILLAKGEKQPEDIESKLFSTAIFLSESCNAYLKELTVENLSKNEADEVAKLLKRPELAF